MDKKARNKRMNSKPSMINDRRARGRPKKNIKIDPNGLRKDQNEWLRGEGEIRGLPTAAIHREAVDWYITAKETKRATVETSKQFDDTFNKGGDGLHKEFEDKFNK